MKESGITNKTQEL